MGGGAKAGVFIENKSTLTEDWVIGADDYVPCTFAGGSTATINLAGHNFIVDSHVHFKNIGGALPTTTTIPNLLDELTAAYRVVSVVAGVSFTVSQTLGGTALVFTNTGSGTHSVAEVMNATVSGPLTVASGHYFTVPADSYCTIS